MHTAAEHTPRPLLNAIVTRAVLLTSSIDGHVADVSFFSLFSIAICKEQPTVYKPSYSIDR